MVDNLIVKNEQLSAQLHDHLKAKNSILLKPEYETFKHLVDTLLLEEKEVSKIYNVLKNRHVHYGEVYQQLTKSRDNLTELYNVQKTSTDLQLQKQIEQKNQYGENPHRPAAGRRKPMVLAFTISKR